MAYQSFNQCQLSTGHDQSKDRMTNGTQYPQTGSVAHMTVTMAAQKTDIKLTAQHQTAHTSCGQGQLKTTVSSVEQTFHAQALVTFLTQDPNTCLLYTSDAADDLLCVDL